MYLASLTTLSIFATAPAAKAFSVAKSTVRFFPASPAMVLCRIRRDKWTKIGSGKVSFEQPMATYDGIKCCRTRNQAKQICIGSKKLPLAMHLDVFSHELHCPWLCFMSTPCNMVAFYLRRPLIFSTTLQAGILQI